jgi:hypothetical protein
MQFGGSACEKVAKPSAAISPGVLRERIDGSAMIIIDPGNRSPGARAKFELDSI